MLRGKYEILPMFDPFNLIILLFWCLWSLLFVAMTICYALWLIRAVRLVGNDVYGVKRSLESCRKYAGFQTGSDRIIGLGSDRRTGQVELIRIGT